MTERAAVRLPKKANYRGLKITFAKHHFAFIFSPDVSQTREAMRGKTARDPRRERADYGTYLGYLRLPRSCAGVALVVGYEDLLYSSLSRRFSPPW